MSTRIMRPRLLTQAARIAAAAYERKRDLKRFLPKLAGTAGRSVILTTITAAESTCEEERRSGAASYSVERHIGLLAALLAETRAKRSAV